MSPDNRLQPAESCKVESRFSQVAVTGFSPTATSLAGGATLTIAGAGFMSTGTAVRVCGDPCEVASVSPTSVTCRAPTSLSLQTGRQTLRLVDVSAEEIELHELGYTPAPSLSFPPAPPSESPQTIDIGRKLVRLAFAQLTPANLPRGATLQSAVVKVTPHSGSQNVVAALYATLDCGSGAEDFSSSASFVEWDVQPFNLGFMTDQTPNLAPLLSEAVYDRDPEQLQFCDVVVAIRRTQGDGERHLFAPTATDSAKRPMLELVYDAPTTAAQLDWAPDRECNVTVAVPVPIEANETCHPTNAASSLSLVGTDACPQLRLTAVAATTADSCAMDVNGVDLFAGCGLDRLVVGRDGVCVAQLDAEEVEAPRAACFDTQTAGAGTEQLASWVENLPVGATAMIVSCSRHAWGYNREKLGLVLARLGALDTPKFLDDAYALVGTKGATSPLAESRVQCCLNPDPVCLTCDQTPAIATVPTACGLSVPAAASTSVLGTESFFGGFGSDSHVAAVEALPGSFARRITASVTSSAGGAIAAFQAEDADVLDAACETVLTTANSDRYGARLATDGDDSTYWLSSGAPDAVLTVDLGATRQVSHLTLNWKSPAYSLLVLYSAASAGDDWRVGATFTQLAALNANPSRMPNSTATLSDGGANAAAIGIRARRLRLYMADAANASHPVFALRELNVTSCAQSELAVTLGSQLAYARAQTPTVTSIAPRRGSTAGGTLITLQVEGLPSGTEASNVSVTVVGLPCAITSINGSSISCLTYSYGKTSAANPGIGPVTLTLPAVGTAAATANASYKYVDLWSRYTTWGGEYLADGEKNTIPGLETTGDSVWIQVGQRILLDCDIDVYMLIVQGALEFDRKDVQLKANYIFVMGGSFTVGTEQDPFLQQALITLHGSPISQARSHPCSLCPPLNPCGDAPSHPLEPPAHLLGNPRLRRQDALVPLLHA